MKIRQATALTLIVWYLITAPYRTNRRVHDLTLPFPGVVYQDTAAPLSWWTVGPSFPTQKICCQ
jgi:hypothetical protein